MVDLQASEHERDAIPEGVDIHTDPDPKLAHPSGSSFAVRFSNTATVSQPAALA
jgi:hypothetical protein